MADPTVDELHQRIQGMSAAHRLLAFPILLAVHRLGGSAKKKDVEAEVRRLVDGKISKDDLDQLKSRGRFGFSRYELKARGFIEGESGTWALTPLGKAYMAAHANDAIEILPFTLEPLRNAETLQVPTERVDTTSFHAFELPVLEVLASGKSRRKDLLEAVGVSLKDKLLPGDFRKLPSGPMVWRFRTNWTLTTLGKDGHAQNVESGQWRITDAGRQRLKEEKSTWDIKSFPSSYADVVVEGATAVAPKPSAPSVRSGPVTLEPLRRTLGDGLVNALHERIRPDLGATPSVATKRNLILYGPPGTGKTHIAKAVARVLTGDTEGGSEGQFRIVQFHPSYSYEDFIQGLKPDLTKTELRYALGKGPFLRIVEDAKNDPNAFYVLVIDEVNRGDPARIFGELLYALEYRDEPVTLPGGGELVVPSNLVIIGTMNSVDRSVALVDYALRRRFGFVRVDPNPETIEHVHGDTTLGNGGAIVLAEFNNWLEKRLDREHVLGHSYFLGGTLDPNSASTFDQVWSLDVRPLLEEYFFGDGDALKEAAAQWKAAVAMALSEDEEAAE